MFSSSSLNSKGWDIVAQLYGGMQVVETGNVHLFGYLRAGNGDKVWVINNFSRHAQQMDPKHLAAVGINNPCNDLVSQVELSLDDGLALSGYQFVWLVHRR